MTERTILLRKAKWHRSRKHWKRARWLESMAFDDSDGPELVVTVGLLGGPTKIRDAFMEVAPGGMIVLMPAHYERTWCRR